jgi:hypothetical protein
MFDNLFTLAGPVGTAAMLLALLLTLNAALVVGMWRRERDGGVLRGSCARPRSFSP